MIFQVILIKVQNHQNSNISNILFTDMGYSEIRLLKGETVVVIGNSSRKGYLVVERNNHTMHVPYQYLQLQPTYNGKN